MDQRDDDVDHPEAAAKTAALGRRADGASGPPAAGSAAIRAVNRAQRRALKYGHTLKTHSRTGRQKIAKEGGSG